MNGLLSKFMGFLLILFGCCAALTVLGFASLIDPSLQGAAWWAEYWRAMERGHGWGSLGMVLFMIAVGGWLIIAPPSEPEGAGPERTKLARDAVQE